MEFHGKFHGIPLDSMEFHGIMKKDPSNVYENFMELWNSMENSMN
jgi:hypothetical protein